MYNRARELVLVRNRRSQTTLSSLHDDLQLIRNKGVLRIRAFVLASDHAIKHFPEHNAETVNVTSFGVIRALKCLGGAITHRSAKLIQRGHIRCGEKPGKTEVANLERPVFIDQEI